MTNPTWKSEIIRTIKENYNVDDVITRQTFCENFLPEIIKNIGSKGKTPDQTLSFYFQRLRNEGYVEFVFAGEYKVLSFESSDVELTKPKKKIKIKSQPINSKLQLQDEYQHKTWPDSVLDQIRENYSPGELFSCDDFCKNNLPIVIKETRCIGLTPEQTLSKTLQDLRDLGYIKFCDTRGIYKVIRFPKKNVISKGVRSKGEKLVYEILTNLGLEFEEQKKFEDLKFKSFLSFDFYFELEDKEFVIEFDGLQHSQPIERFGGDESFKLQQLKDKLKNKYCEKNDIILLRLNELNYRTCKCAIKKMINNQ